MANPADPGTFELLVAGQPFDTLVPKAGDTGDMERLVAGELFIDYVAVEAAPPTGIEIFRRRMGGY